MSCHDCNTENNCPEEVTCGCKMELDSLCVRFTNDAGLPTLGILPGARLEDILIAIDNFLQVLNQSIIDIEARLDELEAGHLTVQEEGTDVLTETSIMNFIGTYVTASAVGTDTVNVDFSALDTEITDILNDVSTNTTNINNNTNNNTSNISTNTGDINTINTEGVLQVQQDDGNVGTTTKTLNFEGSGVTSILDEGSNKTTVTIDGGGAAVYSERAYGGNLAQTRGNHLWFNSDGGEDGVGAYNATSQTVTLSIESFFVDGAEQIGATTNVAIDCTSVNTILLGREIAANSYRPFAEPITTINLANIEMCTFVDWLKLLNDTTNSFGIHIGDDENLDRIYFEDKDWVLQVRRIFSSPEVVDPTYRDATFNYQYRYSYVSSTKTFLIESSSGSADGLTWGAWSTFTVGYYPNITYPYKKLI
jgi:hypothetical protein